MSKAELQSSKKRSGASLEKKSTPPPRQASDPHTREKNFMSGKTFVSTTLNTLPESAALCYGYSLRNRLQKPRGAQSLPHGCDTTQPESSERGQWQNRPMCVSEGQKPGKSVPDRDRKDDGRGDRVRCAAVSARRASLRSR